MNWSWVAVVLKDFQPLIASLAAIAAATIAFRGVVYSQSRQKENLHQDHQNQMARDGQRMRREAERAASIVKTCIIAELSAIRPSLEYQIVNSEQWTKYLADFMAKEILKDGDHAEESTGRVIDKIPIPLFELMAKDIALLPVDASSSIMKVYSQIISLNARNPITERMPVALAIVVRQQITNQAKKLSNDIDAVLMELGSLISEAVTSKLA